MNFVYVSPHFPDNMWLYCRALRERGVNVLGIADTPFELLPQHVRDALSDYYQVDSLEDAEMMRRALGYFTWRHGRIDWLESNNEYWLMQDAWLREQFGIQTGPLPHHMESYRSKSHMKALYQKAGVKFAPWQMVLDFKQAQAFAREVGYPLVVKPDYGVGAGGTYRLKDEQELKNFFEHLPGQPYIMEACVNGEICSYDALIDAQGRPLYETGNITRGNIMDFVNERQDCVFYIVPRLRDDLKEAGRRCVTAWAVKSRAIHFEFFRLFEDQPGIGRKGEVIGLEVNMRPSGGYSTDMINYAGSIDYYRMWADMICYDHVQLPQNRERYFCVLLGRRDMRRYAKQHKDILRDWRGSLMMEARMPRALSDTMGDHVYLARCRDEAEMNAFLRYAQEVAL